MSDTTATVPGLRRPEARRRGLAGHRARQGGHGMEPGLLGLMIFVASEVMFFAGLFAAYFTFRAAAPEWPGLMLNGEPYERLDVGYAALLTVLLVTSSVVIQASIVAIRRNNQLATSALIGFTLLLGLVFIALQGYEWANLEFTVKDGIYGTLFYTITGFHGLHVIGGIVAISFSFWKSLRGDFSARNHTMLEAVSFYWHFVDVVWIGVFTGLYILQGAEAHL